MKTVRMSDMTVLDLREYLKKNRTVVLPYGVVEQHGYHLPLDTDIRNAAVLGEKLAEKLGCIVAPTLTYCFSGGMLEGTINVRPNTFSSMVCEIIESLVMQGFQNVIVLPGHGGSESLLHLKESLRIMQWVNPAVQNAMVILFCAWEYSPTWMKAFKGRDYHAGEIETSLALSWAPGVVRRRVVLDKPAVAEMLREDPDSYQVRACLTDLSGEIPVTRQNRRVKVGVMGYPHKASAETGRRVTNEILRHGVPALCRALDQASRHRKAGRRLSLKDDRKMKILSL